MRGAVLAIRRALVILWVLLRHDLLPLLPENMRHRPLRLLQSIIRPKRSVSQLTESERLRLAFEELGPIFVKFGQLLATRRDLLPLAVAQELSKLQENVTPFSGAARLIEKSLQGPIKDYFLSLDANPLASASIAQVHAATLLDGSDVVVKILRPNIEKQVKQDIRLLRWFAHLLTSIIKELKRFHLNTIVDQYDSIIHKELDLREEAKNSQQFAKNFNHSHQLYVPHIHHEFTKKNLLVIERVYGTPIDDIQTLKDKGVDLKALSILGVEIFFAQVFRDNFFHADMHPGNIHVDTSNPLAPRYISLDCAIVGELEPTDQLLIARKLLALLRKDFIGVAELMIAGHWVPTSTDTQRLATTLERLLTPMLTGSLANIEFGPLLISLFQAAREFDLQALPQFMLLEKTLIHVEGLGKQLDPHLDVFAIGQPLLERWVREKLGPKAMIAEFEKAWPRWMEYAVHGPASIAQLAKSYHLQQQTQINALQALIEQQKTTHQASNLWPWQWLVVGVILMSIFQLMQFTSATGLAIILLLGGFGFLGLQFRKNVIYRKSKLLE